MKIALQDYTPKWKFDFNAENKALLDVIGTNVRIEHIGSTSVEGLCAKPVIDILMGVTCFEESHALVNKITQLGYDYISDYEHHFPERKYFQKCRGGCHLFHIHLVEIKSKFWNEHLLFRDRLRNEYVLRTQYAKLKKDLSTKEWASRNDYAAAKSDFIQGKVTVGPVTFSCIGA